MTRFLSNSFFALVGIFVALYANAQNPNFNGGSLFHFESKTYTRYKMVAGPLVYQARQDEKFSQGYRAKKTIQLDGIFQRFVFDFDESQSALSVYESFKANLDAEGYKTSYSCSGVKCGDPKGWKLFLGRFVAGSSESQFYMGSYLGKENDPVAFKVVHVNEFDNRPRVIVDTLYKSTFEADLDFSSKSMIKLWSQAGVLQQLGEIYFHSNSDQIIDPKQVDKIAQLVKQNGKDSKALLVGFADQRGPSIKNKRLSLARAKSLESALSKQYSIANSNLISVGLGEVGGDIGKARKVVVFNLLKE